jgi:hypothetical protein
MDEISEGAIAGLSVGPSVFFGRTLVDRSVVMARAHKLSCSREQHVALRDANGDAIDGRNALAGSHVVFWLTAERVAEAGTRMRVSLRCASRKRHANAHATGQTQRKDEYLRVSGV